MVSAIVDLTGDDEDVDILERIRQEAPKAPSTRPLSKPSAFRSPAQSSSQASSLPKSHKSSFTTPKPTPSEGASNAKDKNTGTKAPTQSRHPNSIHSPTRSSQTPAIAKRRISSSFNTSRPTPSAQAPIVTPRTSGTILSSDNYIPLSLRNSRNAEDSRSNSGSAFRSPLARKRSAGCTSSTGSMREGFTSSQQIAQAGSADDVRSHQHPTSSVAPRKRDSPSHPYLDSLRRTGLEKERRRSLMMSPASPIAGSPSHAGNTNGSAPKPHLGQTPTGHRGSASFTQPVPGFFHGIPSKAQNIQASSTTRLQSHDSSEKPSNRAFLQGSKAQDTTLPIPHMNRFTLPKRGLVSDEHIPNQPLHLLASLKAQTQSAASRNQASPDGDVSKVAKIGPRDAEDPVTLPLTKQINGNRPIPSTTNSHPATNPSPKQNTALSASRESDHSLVDRAIHIPPDPMQSDDGGVFIQFKSNQVSAFADGFDRGRFPKERRRRGGTKYGTPRVNGFPKSPGLGSSRSFEPVGRLQPKHTVLKRVVRDPSVVRSGSTRDEFVPPVNGSATSTSGFSPTANDKRESSYPLEVISNKTPSHATPPITLPMSSTEHDQLLEFIYSILHPELKKQETRHKERLTGSKIEVKDVSRNVANKLIDDDLVCFLRENDYSTEKSQRKYIRKNIKSLYRRVVEDFRQQCQVVLANKQQKQGFWADIPSKKARLPSPPASNNEVRGGKDPTAPDAQSVKSKGVLLAKLSSHSGEVPDLRLSSPKVEEDVQMARRRLKMSPSTTEAKIHPTSENPSQLQICTQRSPPTASDAQLEVLLAEAALARPSNPKASKVTGNIEIDYNDQTKLVEKKYVVKSISDSFRSRAQKAVAVQSNVVDPAAKGDCTVASLLRHRELGLSAKVDTKGELQLRTLEKLRPWREWKGASSDIVSVAWAPDSLTYAVGAAAHINHEDLEYNRPCNLMLGELSSNQLWELPDHRTLRPTPDRISTGYNSRQETYNACDPVLYQTVGSIAFSSDGKQMYTASYDKTLKVWDTAKGERTCRQTMDHEAVVVAVDVYRDPEVNIVATASQRVSKAIRIYYGTGENIDPVPVELSSSRAETKPDLKIWPERIAWGPTSQTKHLLLAGFSAWEVVENNYGAREGQICLWDINEQQSFKITPASQSVSAAAWHPFSPYFATGGAPGSSALSKSHNTRSVVRTYDPRWLTRCAMEYESTAFDINDITFHPLDSNIVTAGCTDGSSFVWDFRWHDRPLHKLTHGNALMELDHHRHRERSDTGVMISLWGPQGSLYYTGSSDGLVKAWDVRRHPEDVHVRDVAQVGAAIQNGAFSPDFSHLLVGDADGAVHVLSSAPTSSPYDDGSANGSSSEPIRLIRARDGSGKRLDPDEDDVGTEGIEAANELVRSGQLVLDPVYGPGKGPRYAGPYAKGDRRDFREDGIPLDLKRELDRQQTFDRSGRINEEVAAKKRYHNAVRQARLSESATSPFVPRKQGDQSRATADSAEYRVAAKHRQNHESIDPRKLKGARDNVISTQRMLVDDHWWPRLGEEEITKAKQRACAIQK